MNAPETDVGQVLPFSWQNVTAFLLQRFLHLAFGGVVHSALQALMTSLQSAGHAFE